MLRYQVGIDVGVGSGRKRATRTTRGLRNNRAPLPMRMSKRKVNTVPTEPGEQVGGRCQHWPGQTRCEVCGLDNPAPPTQGQQERTMTRTEVEKCPDLAVSVLDELVEQRDAAESLAQRYREALGEIANGSFEPMIGEAGDFTAEDQLRARARTALKENE